MYCQQSFIPVHLPSRTFLIKLRIQLPPFPILLNGYKKQLCHTYHLSELLQYAPEASWPPPLLYSSLYWSNFGFRRRTLNISIFVHLLSSFKKFFKLSCKRITEWKSAHFRVGWCCLCHTWHRLNPYPFHYRTAFAFSTISYLHIPCGRLTLCGRCIGLPSSM